MEGKKITVTKGHLTAGQRRAIKAILTSNQMSGKVNRRNYFIKAVSDSEYLVTMQEMDRGMVPVAGSPIRTSTYKAEFTLK